MAYRSLLKPDGVGLMDMYGLVELLAKDGVLNYLLDRSAHGIKYCNGGVDSCSMLFCLVRCVVPWERICIYCDRINEWADLTKLPIKTG